MLVALLSFAAPAGANHSAIAFVSTGPNAGGPFNSYSASVPSDDGSRVFFGSEDRLVGADIDTSADVYERSGGTTKLVSTGPSGGTEELDAILLDASGNGTRIFFSTRERLVGADADQALDIYERSGNTTTLMSTGPTGGNATLSDVAFGGISSDGTHLAFNTSESLVSADTDTTSDFYERSAGATTLASTGPLDDGFASGDFPPTNTYRERVISEDGSHIFFYTSDRLVVEDTDFQSDIYQRANEVTELVSTGPSDLGPLSGLGNLDFSDDGGEVTFSTATSLVPEDLDNLLDVYKRSGGTTTLASTGPTDTHAWPACVAGSPNPCESHISADGSHVVFFTHEGLTSEDTGGFIDVYDHSGGTTRLVSIGPSGGNGPMHVTKSAPALSKDGSHIVFNTPESLVPSDTDGGEFDLYERFAGTTKLVSTGAGVAAPFPFVEAISEDGQRIIFSGEFAGSTYERFADATTLLFGASEYFSSATPDATHVLFNTRSSYVSADNDYCPEWGSGCYDLYDIKVAYQTPRSASPLRASLVPAYLQCGTGANPADGQHSPPLSGTSCLPPRLGSNVAHFGPQSTGMGELAVVTGNSDSTADEADVSITASLTDIQATAGGDYNPSPSGPDLTLTARLRITDLSNCSGAGCAGPYGPTAATTTDLDFPVAVDCSSTPDPGVGAACAVTTSADAVMAGAVREGQNTYAQAFRLRLNDSGANGMRGDSDDRIFSTQGVYVP